MADSAGWLRESVAPLQGVDGARLRISGVGCCLLGMI